MYNLLALAKLSIYRGCASELQGQQVVTEDVQAC